MHKRAKDILFGYEEVDALIRNGHEFTWIEIWEMDSCV